MINNRDKGLSVFRWLKDSEKLHKNPNFTKKYDMKKFNISEPIDPDMYQKKPLPVNTHPFMLKPWLKLHSFARKYSMCKFEDDVLTGADLIA